MKMFFDTQFTGLHQNTTLISIGLVAENGREFYGEFTDYDQSQIDGWLRDNVLANLIYKSIENWAHTDHAHTGRCGDSAYIAKALETWFASFGDGSGNDKIEMWSNCVAYDWVLFNQLWGHAFNIPEIIYYIPFDLSTLLKVKGLAPDINREKFAGVEDDQAKHNSLWDANVTKACHEKLERIVN